MLLSSMCKAEDDTYSDCSYNTFFSGFPLFARQMYDRLGTVGASALLAGLVTCMVPLPFVFYRIGAGIRERSNLDLGGKREKGKKDMV